MKRKRIKKAVHRTARIRGAKARRALSARSAVQDKNSGANFRIKAIVFDFDGVIIDSYPRALEVWGYAFKEFKITNVTLDKDFFESDYRAMAKKLKVSDHNLKKLERLYYNATTPLNLFKGIVPILKELKHNYKLGLVSNSPSKRFMKKLREYHLNEFFDAIIGIRKGIRLKPHPDMLLLALERLKVKPTQAIFIGDMEGDIIASKAARVKVIGATYGFHTKVRLKGADLIINAPKEIIPAIKKLERAL